MAIIDPVGADVFLGENGVFQEGWQNSLPEDTFEKDEYDKPKQGDLGEHKNLGSLSKSYLNLQQKLGTMIAPLKEGATDAERKEFLAKAGYAVPDNADGYSVTRPTLPEGMQYSEEGEKAFRDFAHSKMWPQKYVTDALSYYNQLQVFMFEASKSAADEDAKQAEAQLRTEWLGDTYDKNFEKANRAYDVIGQGTTSDKFKAAIEAAGLHNNPDVVRWLAEAYTQLGEGEYVEGGGEGGETVPAGQLHYKHNKE